MTAARTPCPVVPCKRQSAGILAGLLRGKLPLKKNSPAFDANPPLGLGSSRDDIGSLAPGSATDLRGGIGKICVQHGNHTKIMDTPVQQRRDDGWRPATPAFGIAWPKFIRTWPAFLARAACIAWVASAILASLGVAPTLAQPRTAALKSGEQVGSVSGLPLPRYVSLKADRVNLREGPSRDHRTTWVFQRAGLPVEVTAEFDVWRKVRDSEGTEGWVLHSLLSGRRTALVAPWKKGDVFTLFASPAKDAPPVARLQSGVIATLKTCDGSWCHISGDGFEGYIAQTSLWGVYPNEKIE